MRIAISTLIVRAGLSGSNESYLVNLVAALEAADSENEYLLFVTPQNAGSFTVANPRFRMITVPSWGYSRAGRILLDQLVLPFWARRLGATVFHYPGTLGSLVRLRNPAQVVTVHYDVDPTHAPSVSRLKRAYYATLMRRTCETARAMIVPSRTFCETFGARWRIPAGKLKVVYHGVGAPRRDAASARESQDLLARLALAPGYLLCVTNALPHKNLPRLLEAYATLVSKMSCRAPLVLVGNISRSALRDWVVQLDAAGIRVPIDRVILTGVVSRAQVQMLYQCAALMVTPTLTESFSLPVLEAMANGCPVVASDIPVHREVGGDAVLLVPPESPAGLSAACSALLTDDGRRDVLVERGLQRAAQFSWERTARATMAVYRSVL